MKVVVVVQIAVPVNVERIDDPVVVVVNVVPVTDAVSVPIVELREGSASRLAPGVGAHRIGVGLRWAVPRQDVRCRIQRERVVLVLDVVVVKVVRSVCTAHGEIAEIVWGLSAPHVGVKPVVDGVVVLVEGAKPVVVKVTVIVDFTIDLTVPVAISTRRFKVGGGHARDGQVALGVPAVHGHNIANAVARARSVDGGVRDGPCGSGNVDGQASTATGCQGSNIRAAVVVCTASGDAETGDCPVLKARVIAGLVAVRIDFNARVRNAVVVVVGVNHVKNAVVVVVRVGRVWRAVVVVVRVEEVRHVVVVKVTIDNNIERRGAV